MQTNLPLRIAQSLKVSESYLRTLFKDALGITLRQYIEMIRLREVANLLLTTNSDIKTIAKMNGYTTTRSLERNFGSRYSQSPSAFRKKPNIEAIPPKTNVIIDQLRKKKKETSRT